MKKHIVLTVVLISILAMLIWGLVAFLKRAEGFARSTPRSVFVRISTMTDSYIEVVSQEVAAGGLKKGDRIRLYLFDGEKNGSTWDRTVLETDFSSGDLVEVVYFYPSVEKIDGIKTIRNVIHFLKSDSMSERWYDRK